MTAPTVYEATIILPDLVCVEIRDSAVNHVGLIAVASPPDAGAYGTWLSRSKTTGGAGSDHAFVTGASKNWLKFQDERPSEYLARAAADVAGNYGTIGGLTVTNVYRKTQPYDWGECYDSLTTKGIANRHFLYLKLSGNLAEGAYTIDFPTGTGIADYAFTFDDKVTRFKGIKSNQYGHAPTDLMKFAYLAEWAPGYGTEGRVSFASITNWHIINSIGAIVWSAGAAPALRIAATDSEPNSGIQADDQRLTSTTTNVRTLVSPGYTNANPCVITYVGDDLTNGMVVRMQDVTENNGSDIVSTLNCRESTVTNHTIANVNNSNPLAKTAELSGVNRSASTATWVSGSGKIYETHTGNNRAATNVYGLDFSAFQPATQGIYRIYVEGYGVSHPFYLDHATWHNVAANMAMGEYHQRHSIAIDGRFGFSRSAGWSVGNNQVFFNLLPCFFSTEVGLASDATTNPATCGLTTSNFHTTNLASFVPGHHDAGDHDARIGSHSIGYYGLMDFYEQYPDAAAAVNWNIPTMVSLFPSDTRYNGTSILPACLQQAMFAIHGYAETKTAAGHIRGGANQSGGTNLTPSWLERSANGSPVTTATIFVYGPDHLATITFCQLPAKMAICLRKWDTDHGTSTFATLAQYYEDLAVETWNAFELVYDAASVWGSGSSGAVTDARVELYDTGGTTLSGGYRTACEVAVPGAFDTNFNSRQTSINAGGRRHAAAAILYRMTGNITYGNIVTTSGIGPGTAMDYQYCIAAYEYCLATHANRDTAKQATYKTTITDYATVQITDAMYGDIGFKSLKFSGGSGSFGNDGTDWERKVLPIITAYILSERATPGSGAIFKKAMEDGWHYGLGANLTGKSLTTGLGTDVVSVALHSDSMAQGDTVPKGIMVYGPCDRGITAGLSLQTGALNWVTINSPASLTTDFEHDRHIDPPHFAWPRHEHFYESPGLIEMTEYVFGGSIAPQQWVASVLWAGNGVLKTQLGEETIISTTGGGAGHRFSRRFNRTWRGKYAGYFDDREWVEYLLAAMSGEIAELPEPKPPQKPASKKLRRKVVEPEAYIEKAYPEVFNGLLELKLSELEMLAAQRQTAQVAKLIEAAARKKRRYDEEDDIAFLLLTS